MIKQFYSLAIPRFRNNKKIYNRYLNYFIIIETIAIGKICEFFVKHFYTKKRKALESGKDERIIVSITTIPRRIRTIPIVLKSMFNQTLMPDKIILWLTDEIEDKDSVKDYLRDEISSGLEIRFINDLRVHTKYYYSKIEYPNDLIITIDDDILYPENLIEELYNVHVKYRNEVIAARAHEITYANGRINPYRKWHKLAPDIECAGDYLFATGVGGVLYPPNCFYKDWMNTNIFLDMCPTADDIWLKVMELLNGTRVIKLNKWTREPFIIGNTQKIALSKQNVGDGKNDLYLQKCIEHYHLTLESFK